MTTFWNTNQNPTTGAQAMFQLIQCMLSGGWVQAGSGDATTFSNSGVGPVANGSAGVTGLGNNSSWVRLQAPIMTYAGSSSKRELCIQHGSTNDRDWWIRYSISGSFIGTGNGAISATVTPTATEQVNLWGSTAAGTQLFDASLTYRCHTMAHGSHPHGFYLLTIPNGGTFWNNGNKTVILMDPCSNTSSLDPDPYVFYIDYSTQVFLTYNGGGGRWYTDAPNAIGLFSPVTSSANYKTINAATYPTALGGNGGTACDPFGGKDFILPVFYGRRSNQAAPVGPKGFGTLLFMAPTSTGLAEGYVGKATGETLSIASTGANDKIVVSQFCLPWNGSVVKV